MKSKQMLLNHKQIIQNCSCFYSYLPVLTKDVHPCSSFNETLCIIINQEHNFKDINILCGSQCPIECEFVSYDFTTSVTDYPTHQYFDDIKNDLKRCHRDFQSSYNTAKAESNE